MFQRQANGLVCGPKEILCLGIRIEATALAKRIGTLCAINEAVRDMN